MIDPVMCLISQKKSATAYNAQYTYRIKFGSNVMSRQDPGRKKK